MRALYYSATIITLDGSSTNAYGEGCEPGRGYREQSGHWSPDQSYWTVHPSREQVQPDVYPGGCGQRPGQWLAGQITTRLGTVDDFDGGHTFYSAREAIHPGRVTGPDSEQPGAIIGSATLLGDALAAARLRQAPPGTRTLTAAAHAYGFTDGEITDAARILRLAAAQARAATFA